MAVSMKKIPIPLAHDKKDGRQNSEDIARKALQNCMKSKCRKLSKEVFNVKK
jgi:hypothetical protein